MIVKGLCIMTIFCSGMFVGKISAQQNSIENIWPENYSNITFDKVTLPDTVEINSIMRKADSLYILFPDSSIKLATIAFQKSKQISYTQGMGHALNNIGISLQKKNMHDSAIKVFQQAMPYAQKIKRKSIYRLYSNMIISYYRLGKYESFLDNAYKATAEMKANKHLFDFSDSIVLYTNIGYIWAKLSFADHSLNTLNIALNTAQRANDTKMISAVYGRMSVTYLIKGQDSIAESFLLKSLESARRYNKDLYEIETLNTLSHLYIDKSDLNKALYYTQKALELLEAHPEDYDDSRLHTYHNLGCIYLKKKQYAKAESFLIPALQEAERSGPKDIIPHIESDVAALYAATGRHDKAYKHMLNYARIKDTIFEQQRMKSLDIWLTMQNSEKDKAMMEQQLYITRQQSQLQTKNFWMGSIVIGTLMLLTLFIVSIRSYRNKQRLQQSFISQLQQEQQINQLKAQVRGEEQERNRIAVELHDGIASQLWAIKLNIDNLKQQNHLEIQHKNSLHSIYQQLEDTTQEVRKTAHNLMPDLLIEEGLATALASFCEKIKKQTDLEVDFFEFGSIPRMDPDVELSLYRMIQELVQNVLKHAKNATHLLVQLGCVNTILNITVEDNGKGLDASEHLNEKGVGLTHIEKRVKDLQGHIDIHGVPDAGTTVYMEFDINNLIVVKTKTV